MHRLMLTFDIEDFINPNAMSALQVILEMLSKYSLRGIFFVTGHVAEKLRDFPRILDLIANHEIGFHSSSHSVRPIIPEYTDVESYQRAYSTSLERETSHINPLTGKMEGEGGIWALQDLFSPKKIETYRAPGMSWTPPHLEALANLGIRYDFSSTISISEPVCYKSIGFYPYTLAQHWTGSVSDCINLLYALLNRKVAILSLHPSLYVNKNMWDAIYHKGNPQTLQRTSERPLQKATSLLGEFEKLLRTLAFIQKTRLVDVDPRPNANNKDLFVTEDNVEEYYETSVRWPRAYFNYNPRYIRAHFEEFFESANR